MNRNLRTGDTVIFFFQDSERAVNNLSTIAPATVVNRPWSKGGSTLQLKVHTDGPDGAWASSCPHADTLDAALKGYCWATIEECEAWGIDLEDNSQDLLLLSRRQKETSETTQEAQKDEEKAESDI